MNLNLTNKKRVALCYSGHLRYIDDTIENHKRNIIEPNDADVYVYTSDVMTRLDKEKHYVKPRKGVAEQRYKRRECLWYKVDVPEFEEKIKHHFGHRLEDLHIYDEKIRHTNKSMRFNWHWYKSGQMKKIYKANELSKKKDYDVIVRIRTDFLLNKPMIFDEMNDDLTNALYTFGHSKHHKHMWDGFAAGSRRSMDIYCDIFNCERPYRNQISKKYSSIHKKHQNDEFWVQLATHLDIRNVKKINLETDRYKFFYEIYPVPTRHGYGYDISDDDPYKTLYQKYSKVL